MGKRDKLLADIRAKKAVRFEQIQTLLTSLGFVERSSGSHHSFKHHEKGIRITMKKVNPLREYTLNELAQILDRLGP